MVQKPDRFLRDFALYSDAAGRTEIAEQLKRIAKSDGRGSRAIQRRIRLVRQMTFDAALQQEIVKKPSATIYVLRVQSGPVSYRLPFFEPLCFRGRLIVFTHCEKRAHLRASAYDGLVEEAEARRRDWIARNCKKEEEPDERPAAGG